MIVAVAVTSPSGEPAEAERLLELPAMPFPAITEDVPVVAANALVAVDGNRYSVPPEHVGHEVTVRRRLGDPTLEVVSAAGRVIATHQTAPQRPGTGGPAARTHQSARERRVGIVHH